MAARKKAKQKTAKRPTKLGRFRFQKPTQDEFNEYAERYAASRTERERRSIAEEFDSEYGPITARDVSTFIRNSPELADSLSKLRAPVERSTRPKLKRNKQGGLREYQGPTFGRTKFGGYKEALKRVGEESQHAYDEAVESLREALDNDASEATIKRRRNKVWRLKK